jgi:hypothetical protein
MNARVVGAVGSPRVARVTGSARADVAVDRDVVEHEVGRAVGQQERVEVGRCRREDLPKVSVIGVAGDPTGMMLIP